MSKIKIIIIIVGLLLIFSSPPNTYASSINKDGVVGLVNQERIERGLNSLTVNDRLQTAAQWKAEDMIEKDYWEHFHNGKSPWAWMNEAGYDYMDAGENLAIDFSELELVHQAWMNSPTHKENIINPKYKEIGIGIASGDFEGHETIVVVQMFGNPSITEVSKEEPRQFTAQAEEKVQVSAVSEVKKNFWQKIISNYKNNFKRGLAYLSAILLQNNSASANY